MRKPNSAIGILATGILTSVAPVPAVAQDVAAPVYERVPCDFSPRPRFPRELTRECGLLTVPEVRGRANGRTYRLAVVVYHPPERTVRHHSCSCRAGRGPIGGTLFPWWPMTWPLARQRDMVTFDYRGVSRSEPKVCPDFEKQADPAFYRTAAKEREDLYRAAVRTCLATLETQGIDRNAFGGDVFAQDAIDLRRPSFLRLTQPGPALVRA